MVTKTTKLAGALALFSVVAAGCGDDENVQKGTVNMAQARNSVTQASTLRAHVEANDGNKIANGVQTLNASASNIVTPAAGKALTVESDDPVMAVVQAQMAAGSPECGPSSCKFNNFNVGGYALAGDINWTAAGDGKRIKWDLTMKASSAAAGAAGVPAIAPFSLDYSGKGDITVSATKLDGSFSTKATFATMAQGQSASGGWEATVKYNGVALTNGQPTGGTLYAKWKAYGSSGGQSSEQAYEGTVDFK
jgi:hypothetical protein